MSFGYATGEFEVTDERLGVYRPEEHIDNPKDYADNGEQNCCACSICQLVSDGLNKHRLNSGCNLYYSTSDTR